MENRCRICGTPISHIKICNHCRTVNKERRFFKMINHEELKAARTIDGIDKTTTPPPDSPLK